MSAERPAVIAALQFAQCGAYRHSVSISTYNYALTSTEQPVVVAAHKPTFVDANGSAQCSANRKFYQQADL